MVSREDRFKDAFKLALAITLAYWAALTLGWEKPYWAALAVAMCSSTSMFGDSLNKGLLRVSGTLLALVATLTLVALFPQQRWEFLAGMTGFIAFCTLMMFRTPRWYFWFVAGFSVPMLALIGGTEALTTFEIVLRRAEETTLGVLCYSLVAALIWPRSSAAAFRADVAELVAAQRKLVDSQHGLFQGAAEPEDTAPLRARATQISAGLAARLDGAALDSFRIWEDRRAWRRLVEQLSALNHALERWRQNSALASTLDLRIFMPRIDAFCGEMSARLDAIGAMLAGRPADHEPRAPELLRPGETLASRPRFERAALILGRDLMVEIEHRTRELFETVAAIQGPGPTTTARRRTRPEPAPAIPDPDHLARVGRVVTGLWIAILVWIYVPDVPQPSLLLVLPASVGMTLAVMPTVPLTIVLLPALTAIAFAGALHVLVMPHLSGFEQLGAMVFTTTFLIGFLFAQPRQVIGRSIGLSIFAVLTGIANDQHYSFLGPVNAALALLVALGGMMLATHFPVSFRPERVVLRSFTRFFRSCEWLLGNVHAAPGSRIRAFHARTVATLPGRLVAWVAALPPDAVGDEACRARLQALVTGLQALAFRMEGLLEARTLPQAQVLVDALTEDLRGWRVGVQGVCSSLSSDPGAEQRDALQARLSAELARLESRVAQVMDALTDADVSTAQETNMHRILGAYRGLSEAVVDFAGRAAGVDWARLREARF